ncbi:MAG: phage tail sheath subtilisin-like domain-containing protein, partial [Planctomycetota bacterium]
GDTATQVATKITAAIASRTDLPVTASSTSGTVTLTAKHDGTIGNQIDVRVAALEDERVPTGVSITVGAMVDGAGEPDLDSALEALGDEQYHVLATPYTETAALTAIVDEVEQRAEATRQLGGIAVAASTAALATLEALGGARNSERLVLLGAPAAPSSPWQWAAALAGALAREGQNDPARPLTTVELEGILPARAADRPNDLERDALLRTGVATTVVNAGGNAAIERVITTYRQNDLGAEDPTFLDVQSVLTLELIRFEMRQLGGKFARFKVADDGEVFAPGQEVLTPNALKGEIVALYAGWVERGLCENSDEFGSSLIVERDPTDRSRLNVSMNPDIVNALRVLGVRVILTL